MLGYDTAIMWRKKHFILAVKSVFLPNKYMTDI